MKLFQILGLILLFPVLLWCQSPSDVNANDPNYNAINQAVDQGYMSLFDDQTFQPQKPISRSEMAFLIQKLTQTIQANQNQLTEVQIKELLHLAQMFKAYLEDTEADSVSFAKTDQSIQSQLDAIESSISEVVENQGLAEEVQKNIEENQKESQKLLWIGIVSAALVGIIL